VFRRKISIRTGAILIVLHGLMEVSGLFVTHNLVETLETFGSLTNQKIDENTSAIIAFGVVWGFARLAIGWGIWNLQKWAILSGVALSVTTLIVAITIIPAGIVDSALAIPALFLLLFGWYGNEKVVMNQSQ
jgi:hypothetical protein